ncbi:hypothetical protein KAR91_25020 [Candidatus Pacearchaeota archaeon]|nr:hypothetical protein [Candidatus Pacearchaeota archaeon]
MSLVHEKLKKIFLKTIESDVRYQGSLTEIDYFNLTLQTAQKEAMYKSMGVHFCMLNFLYESEDSVLMIFAVPTSSENGTKQISEKVMEIIGAVEKAFITLDYSNSEEVKDDKFTYVVIVKKYNRENPEYFQKIETMFTKKKEVEKLKKLKKEMKEKTSLIPTPDKNPQEEPVVENTK